jgi:hypothetical protein
MEEKGSVLVLTTIVVLILSLLATGLLTVGTTETYATKNFHLNKAAYYMAVQGVEEIRNTIYNTPDADTVGTITKSVTSTLGTPESSSRSYVKGNVYDGMDRFYITGSLYNMEKNTPQPLTQFLGFDAPPFPGMSISTGTSIAPVVWKVNVSAGVRMGKRAGRAEIVAGVYSILVTGYN